MTPECRFQLKQRSVGFVKRIVPCSEVSYFAHRQAYKLAAKPLSALIETNRLVKKTLNLFKSAW
jgi:hypothetical protein